ncbi:MAG TPA: thermopsin family protease [Thermoplasmata archaeon]|nr:thermopsin family protease [Thermoplasmata archaeon]
MSSSRAAGRSLWLAVVLLLLLGSTFTVGLAAAGTVPPSHAPQGASAGAPTHGVGRGAIGPGTSRALPPGVTASPLVEKVRRQIASGAIDGRNAFLPSPFTSHAQPPTGSAVTPVPLVAPGPMGIADLGIGPGGAPYVYNSSSFEGTVELGAFSAYSPGYAEFAEAPDWTTFQMNAVGVNISYPGSSTGTFWFQNVVHFNGSELQVEDNIWNFSSFSALMAPGTLYSHGPNGVVELNEFYFAYGPTIPVTYPFTLSLAMTLEVVATRPTVLFNYTLTNGSGPAGSPHTYDQVSFNGASVGPPQFQVNGGALNPYGSEYDSELILGGDGGGTNANIVSLRANATLDHWDAATHRYVSVPSAYDHGVDSGETSTGVAEYYLPHQTTVFLNQGPSLLYGLWNTSSGPAGPAANPGYIHVDLTVSPDYAFVFATNHTAWSLGLGQANFTAAPSSITGVTQTALPPIPAGNPYVFGAWADGFKNGTVTVSGNSTGTAAFPLVAAASTVDAPVYLRGDAQAAAFGAARIPHTGYAPTKSILWINASQADLVAPFLQLNDFDYPTFVLFAAESLNLTVHVNGLVQAAASFVYTSSYPFFGALPGVGWTQGYFFFYGTGRFSVENTTLTGNTSLYYRSIASPGALEFYRTADSVAKNILSKQDSLGVTAIESTDATFTNVSSVQGANAVSLVNATGVTATGVATSGTDYVGTPSVGAYVDHSADVGITDLNLSGGSIGVYGLASLGITVRHVVAVTTNPTRLSQAFYLNGTNSVNVQGMVLNSSEGVVANDSSDQTFSGITATSSPGIGLWANGTDLAVDGLSSALGSFGLQFQNDTAVTVQNARAVDDSTAVYAFANSTGGTFENVSAVNGSIGLLTDFATAPTLLGIHAANGSIGADLVNSSFVTASNVSATNLSNALVWNWGAHGTISNVSIGNSSLGVDVSNASEFTVRGVAASEATLVANTSYYIFNPFTYQLEPSAAVALYKVANGTVENVSAKYYPFAVWANYTNYSKIENVSAWNGSIGISLNLTHFVEIARAFLYDNQIGAYVLYSNNTTITASTFEGSASYGVYLLNGSFVRVDANNFVANNGASVKGVFSTSHVQAFSLNGSRVFFNGTGFGNFWSDHSGSGAYVIHSLPGVLEDHNPATAFISNWLQFIAKGLRPATPWGFTLNGTSYWATAPLVFLPNWSIPDRSLGYTVLSPAGYVPHPAAGTAAALGIANETIIIDFSTLWTVTFTETNLPAATSWSVTLNGTTVSSTTTTVVFHELNGTYPYTIGVVPDWTQSTLPRTGSITVAGANVNERTIAWTEVTYGVTFLESGLPSHIHWSVTVDGVEKSLTTDGAIDSLTFSVGNGTVPYTITDISGWSQSTLAASGNLVVNGAAVTEPTLIYTEVTYLVTFMETGLPSGANWSVTFNGVLESSTGTTITFQSPNGSFHYKITGPGGYSVAGGSSGTLTVSAGAASQTVAFHPSSSSPPAAPWLYVGIGAAAILALLGIMLLLRSRRRGRAPPRRPRPSPTEKQDEI